MAVLSLALAAGCCYGATAVKIEGNQVLVLLTFIPPAVTSVVAAGLDLAAAMRSGRSARRLLEVGLVLFGISLGWLAFCGVLAAGADLLGANGGAAGVGNN
jgi:NO-binding membrane sensor protein with MHYT domain